MAAVFNSVSKQDISEMPAGFDSLPLLSSLSNRGERDSMRAFALIGKTTRMRDSCNGYNAMTAISHRFGGT